VCWVAQEEGLPSKGTGREEMGQGKGKGRGKEDSLPGGITFYKQVTFYKTF